MEKIKLPQAILVEGKYDAIRLASLFDALIVPTNGFQIYRDEQQRNFLKRLAAGHGVIIATDSDAAGFQIRAYVKGFLPAERVWHVLIPDVPGRERRKTEGSKEGKLGVEGMETAVLLEAFRRAGVALDQNLAGELEYVTKAALYRDGFSGKPGSKERYQALLRKLDLPERLSANLFCGCVPKEEYNRILESGEEI